MICKAENVNGKSDDHHDLDKSEESNAEERVWRLGRMNMGIGEVQSMGLKLKPNQICGIVGYECSGRNHLVEILSKNAKATRGSVYIGGKDVIELDGSTHGYVPKYICNLDGLTLEKTIRMMRSLKNREFSWLNKSENIGVDKIKRRCLFYVALMGENDDIFILLSKEHV
uniref:ABC transporter domain-containing protein n=1 Tax=Rhabditophanes sp. KR3021 TaxID=114890 RepID=A0AC35TX09_9BILA